MPLVVWNSNKDEVEDMTFGFVLKDRPSLLGEG